MGDPILLAAPGQFDSIGADVRDLTMRRTCKDGRRSPTTAAGTPIAAWSNPLRDGSGLKSQSLSRGTVRSLLTVRFVVEEPFGVGKAESVERDVLDELARPRDCPPSSKTCASRGATICALFGSTPAGGISRTRPVARIDVELARLGQALADVFDPVAVARIEHGTRSACRSG